MSRRSAGRAVILLLLAATASSCARPPKKIPGPPPPAVSAAAASQAGFIHTVERGQTLYRISKNYHVDLRELMRVNRIGNASKLEVGQQLFIPQTGAVSAPPAVRGGVYSPQDIRWLVGSRRSYSTWRTITVHHSGTLQGGAAAFNRDHARRRMGGLFYHFVIGNGTQSRDGQIEVGWRWNRQIKANRPFDIQICVVGDFNRRQISETQFASLVALIQTLRADYGIPVGGIRRHEDIPGKHTACPGRHFPFDRLISAVS